MISGVLFLNPEKAMPISRFFSRYVLKLFLTLVLIAIPAEVALQVFLSGFQFFPSQIKMAILNIVSGKTQTHFWFLYLIIGLYLITPLLRTFTKYANKKEYEYILVLLFVFTSFIATVKKICAINIGFNIPISSAYVMYFLLGYYLHHYNISVSNKVTLPIILCFVLYTSSAALNKNLVNPLMDNFLITSDKDSPIIAITASAIFIICQKNFATCHYLDKYALLCFGIYIVHPFFIYTLYFILGLTPVKYPLYIFLPVTILTTFALSIGTSFCAKRTMKTITKIIGRL